MHLRPLLVVVLAVVCGNSIAEDKHPERVAVLVAPTVVSSSPSETRADKAASLSVGDTVRIVQTAGAWHRIEGSKSSGWIPAKSVARPDQFRPLPAWHGPAHLEATEGDYSATYSIKTDGTFTVKDIEQDKNEEWKTVTRRGRFHRLGNLYWARVPGEPVTSERIFIGGPNNNYCWWLGYVDGWCSP